MKRNVWVLSLAIVCGLFLPATGSAENYSFNVKPGKDFVLNAVIYGSTQVLLDAAWPKANGDMDIFSFCDELPAISFSEEAKHESLQFGVADGGTGQGVACEIFVTSYIGSSGRGNLTVLFASDSANAAVFTTAVGTEASPAAAEFMARARRVKGRRAPRN